MKTCSMCNKSKDLACFTKHKCSSDGLHSWCRSCRSIYYKENKGKWLKSDLKRRYNMTVEEYTQLKDNQSNCCYICGKTEKENNRKLAIDHCHSTNNIRKLLCDRCNRVLGLVKEDKEVLSNMISYLMEHNFEN